MPKIILKQRIAHLGSYTFLQEMLINIKSLTSLPQLYQPPRTVFSLNTYHWLLSSCEYCKVFKHGFFYRTPPKAVVCRYSSKQVSLKVSQTSQESTCVGVSFEKNCRLKTCNFIKKTPTQVFSCEIFKNTFSQRKTSGDCFCTSGGCFCIFLKKYYLTAISQPCYDVLIIFSS